MNIVVEEHPTESLLVNVPGIKAPAPRAYVTRLGQTTGGNITLEFSVNHHGGGSEAATVTPIRLAIGRTAITESMTAFGAAFRQLEALRQLPANWDSYGADPISGKAVRAARGLLYWLERQPLALRVAELRPLLVAPLAHGGVGLEWRGPTAEIEVEIGADGEYGYLIAEGPLGDRRFTEGEGLQLRDLGRTLARTLTGGGGGA